MYQRRQESAHVHVWEDVPEEEIIEEDGGKRAVQRCFGCGAEQELEVW